MATTTAVNESTQQALENRLLAPKFYRTDYKAMNTLDVSPVRREWDVMMANFEEDKNRAHFKQSIDFDPESLDVDMDLKRDFLDFLVSSITSEYSL
mgnify:FL=1